MMSAATQPVHLDVVRRSAELYLEHLQTGQGERSPGAQRVAERLVVGLRDVLDGRGLDRFDFGADTIKGAKLNKADLGWLINEYTLGAGADDARVIAMGTEEGYQGNGADLAMWNCTCAMLWLTGSPFSLVRRLAKGMPDDDKKSVWPGTNVNPNEYLPYHRYPNHWADLQGKLRGGQSTYGVLTRLIGAPDVVHLDDYCYQIERSAAPALQASDGRPITSERISFLVHLLHEFQSTARLLVLHGKTWLGDGPAPRGASWYDANQHLTDAFLGSDLAEPTELVEVTTPRRYRAKVFRAGDRTVLWMWAPGAHLSTVYQERLRVVVERALA